MKSGPRGGLGRRGRIDVNKFIACGRNTWEFLSDGSKSS